MYNKLYETITDALVHNGYVILENALEAELSKTLKNFAQSQADFRQAGISGAGSLHLDAKRRRDKIYWLDSDEVASRKFLGFANGLKEYLNRELYLGLSYYESHFALYEEGDFYETHLDAFKNSKNRVVTTVYYLNDGWSESDGGELVIYDKDNKFLAKVIPQANTLIVFMSEKFPHEVLPSKGVRYSIAGWFRVDK